MLDWIPASHYPETLAPGPGMARERSRRSVSVLPSGFPQVTSVTSPRSQRDAPLHVTVKRRVTASQPTIIES